MEAEIMYSLVDLADTANYVNETFPNVRICLTRVFCNAGVSRCQQLLNPLQNTSD